MLRQTVLDTCHRVGGHVHAPILTPFALHHPQSLLLPINLLQLELGHLRDAQSTAEHHQKQGPVHGMVDLGKEALDLLPREGFGQGTPAPHKVTRLDRVPHHQLLVQAIVKKVLQGIEPPIDRRPRPAVVMLVFHKLVDLAKRHLGEGDGHLRKEQVEITGITRDGMRRELPALQVQAKPVHSSLTDVIHPVPPLHPVVLFDLGHGLVILRAFGPVIELGIAQGHVEGAVTHQLFDDFQRRPRIEELGGKRMPQRVG